MITTNIIGKYPDGTIKPVPLKAGDVIDITPIVPTVINVSPTMGIPYDVYYNSVNSEFIASRKSAYALTRGGRVKQTLVDSLNFFNLVQDDIWTTLDDNYNTFDYGISANYTSGAITLDINKIYKVHLEVNMWSQNVSATSLYFIELIDNNNSLIVRSRQTINNDSENYSVSFYAIVNGKTSIRPQMKLEAGDYENTRFDLQFSLMVEEL